LQEWQNHLQSPVSFSFWENCLKQSLSFNEAGNYYVPGSAMTELFSISSDIGTLRKRKGSNLWLQDPQCKHYNEDFIWPCNKSTIMLLLALRCLSQELAAYCSLQNSSWNSRSASRWDYLARFTSSWIMSSR
jgi:hypothetical protein